MSHRSESLIGLDIGTTGARAVAIDLSGNLVAQASESYPLATPRPGWAEQDPRDWWAAGQSVLRRVASTLGAPPLCLALTGQMHGAVFLDAADEVIRPAILWNDQRTAAQCRAINEKVGPERLIAITGNPAVTGFQAPKILWLRDEEPAQFARVRRILLPKDYVRLRLTGDFATDASDASGTMLLELRRRGWSSDLLEALEIPAQWLPTIFESPAVTGTLTAAAAEATGLPAGLLVAAGASDNAAAGVGNGVVREGVVSSSIGTSGVVFAHSDRVKIDPLGRLHAFCHAVPGAYHLMGVTLSAGGSLRWWRDIGAPGQDFEAMTERAGQAPPGSDGLVFLPYLAGERTPHLDPFARGAFVGLTIRHTSDHLTRAVMEGVAYSLKDSLDLIADLEMPVHEVRATGGGARSPLWRQLQADVFGRVVHRTEIDEGPAFGAALLAGVAGGAFADVKEACSLVRLDPQSVAPDAERHRLYMRYHELYRDLYRATAPLMHGLSSLSGGGEWMDPR